MATGKRKTYNVRFKGKVAIDALKEANTVAEIAHKYGVHTTQVGKWKRHALASIPDLFMDGRTVGGKGTTKTGDPAASEDIQDKRVRDLDTRDMTRFPIPTRGDLRIPLNHR